MRVCPSIKSRKGWVWTKNVYAQPHWMVDVTVRVTGRLKHGADGMVYTLCAYEGRFDDLYHNYDCMQAIWFTQNAGVEGPVFGNSEVWRGLGVVLDSFDNDGLVSTAKSSSCVCVCKMNLCFGYPWGS